MVRGYIVDILINAILPIFLIIFLGWLLAYFNLVSTKTAEALMQYVFYAAAPAIVIWAITDYQFSQLLYWRFWIAYSLSTFIVIFGVAAIYKYILRRDSKDRFWPFLSGGSASITNAIMIGFPIFDSVVGSRAAIPMAIILIIFFVFLTPPLMLLFELHTGKDKHGNQFMLLLSALKGTITNPVIIGVAIGVIIAGSHITLPKFLETFIHTLGFSMAPCALFSVGLGLKKFSIKGNLLDVGLITFVKLIITPAISIIIAMLLGVSGFYSVALVIFSTAPTAKLIYVYAKKYRVYEKEVAAIISLTTILSILSIPLYIYISKILWPVVFVHTG